MNKASIIYDLMRKYTINTLSRHMCDNTKLIDMVNKDIAKQRYSQVGRLLNRFLAKQIDSHINRLNINFL